MSYLYDEYLHDHISGVRKGYNWLIDKGIMPMSVDLTPEDIDEHDKSKYGKKEYDAYDKYFYGGNKSFKVVRNFNYAWLHHIHHNEHHWHYWVLQHDDEPEEILEMPEKYVYEMICDWWSFSWKSGDLYEIFDWYEKHKDMKLHQNTRKLVEDILEKIKAELDKEKEESNFLEHHGVEGQKWGVQNGPPYPLSAEKLAEKLYATAKEKEPEITSQVEYSTREAGSKLYGLEHKLKTKESILRKIKTDSEEKGVTESQAASNLKDCVRYTTVSPDDEFVNSYNKFKTDMKDNGYEEVRCKNYFDLYRQGKVKHKSVQSIFSTDDGYLFEVQFHTNTSLMAKNDKVPIYEERRKTGVSEERKKELELEMEKLAEKVTQPKDIYSIKSH